ncbi:MAG: hypothetical protein RIS29_591 [Bacteroidota bacterium]|jgi:1-acyl-sn-glycerol-3-phosphate acyltransferase
MRKNPFFFVYQWLIAMPVLLVVTIVVAVSTIILSPLLPNSQLSYHPARVWAKLFCYLNFVRVNIDGLDRLDIQKSYVFALNHQSIFDVFVVYGWFPHIFKWMMKAELRRIPFVGKACQSAGHIFIDRTSPVAAKKSLEKAEAVLKDGVSLVVFPEGTRTKTGKMGVFKRGAFRIATDLMLPIVPVTLSGSFERMHRGSLNIHPGRIHVTVHEPIDVAAYLPDNTSELIQTTFDVIQFALV